MADEGKQEPEMEAEAVRPGSRSIEVEVEARGGAGASVGRIAMTGIGCTMLVGLGFAGIGVLAGVAYVLLALGMRLMRG